MKIRKLLLMLPFVFVFALAACDGETAGRAQDLGASTPEPEVQAMTNVVGKVIPPGDDSCNGTFPGFMEGDDVEIDMSSMGGDSGTGSVTLNGGTDGMIACSADGVELQRVDSPPIANIICAVTSVSSGFTGVSVGDLITMVINFSGESPEQKEAAVIHMESCVIVGIENLNTDS